MPDHHFELQFSPSLIDELSSRFNDDLEEDAMAAGKEITAGNYNRANLVRIYRWKNRNRGISRLERDNDAEIADTLQLAVSARTERAAISVLTGLFGIEIPTGSAILTAIDPQRYTIIDFRALEALGNRTEGPYSIDFYLKYLQACRDLARGHGVSLRKFDQALWQWSSERSLKKACAAGA